MTSGSISPGCVLHWKGYTFSNGAKADKYFVIAGAKQGSNYLAIIATSQPGRRAFVPGCHPKDGYYHIAGGKKDFFPKDTWLLVAEPIEMIPAELIKLAMVEKAVTIEAQLRTEVASAIRNCLKICPDISAAQLALVF